MIHLSSMIAFFNDILIAKYLRFDSKDKSFEEITIFIIDGCELFADDAATNRLAITPTDRRAEKQLRRREPH